MLVIVYVAVNQDGLGNTPSVSATESAGLCEKAMIVGRSNPKLKTL